MRHLIMIIDGKINLSKPFVGVVLMISIAHHSHISIVDRILATNPILRLGQMVNNLITLAIFTMCSCHFIISDYPDNICCIYLLLLQHSIFKTKFHHYFKNVYDLQPWKDTVCLVHSLQQFNFSQLLQL